MSELKLSVRQSEFINAVMSGNYSELLYGGAMGGVRQ